MDITWLGHACFRLRGKESTIVIDPYDKSSGYTLGKPTADIVLISHEKPGHNNVGAVQGEPHIIRGPGEYEIGGVSIVGVQTSRGEGKTQQRNTVYAIQMDDLNICHLGGLGHLLTEQQVEQIGNVDILLVPVGNGDSLAAAPANEIVNLLKQNISSPCITRPSLRTTTWSRLIVSYAKSA